MIPVEAWYAIGSIFGVIHPRAGFVLLVLFYTLDAVKEWVEK